MHPQLNKIIERPPNGSRSQQSGNIPNREQRARRQKITEQNAQNHSPHAAKWNRRNRRHPERSIPAKYDCPRAGKSNSKTGGLYHDFSCGRRFQQFPNRQSLPYNSFFFHLFRTTIFI